MDSPLAVEATNIYSHSDEMRDYYDSETLTLADKGINPLRFEGLCLSVTSEESKMINFDDTPKVIISASGMCEAGRIRHHLKHNLWRSECTVLFVGYQTEGTFGRKLIEGASSVKLFGEEIFVKAQIEQMDGISGHADRDMMLNWLKALKNKPERVFVNHGSDEVCDEFAALITENLSFDATAPYSGAEYDLQTGICIKDGNRTRIVRAERPSSKSVAVFQRLLDAGKRLMRVIEHNRGGANKDIARFADEINKLSEKWDR